MQFINVNDLKPHPRNTEFFDDMAGEKWEEFLESVRTSGIIEPVVITQDSVIVSGHQRVRACKELGIKQVVCDMKKYESEDKILKDLIETNVRQRGSVGGSAKKIGLRIKELERLYGVTYGGDRKSESKSKPNNSDLITQADIATKLGISVDTLQNYKMLADMIPELEDLLDTGIVTKTTALAMMKELSPEEQEELISSLDATKKVTKVQMQKYIDEIKRLKENPVMPADYESTKTALEDYKGKANKYKEEVTELKDKLEIAENYKADEEEKLKKLESMYENRIAALECDKQILKNQMETDQKKVEKFDKLNDEINFLTKQKTDLARQIKSATELAELTVTIQSVLEKDLAPIKFKRCIDDLDKNEVAVKNLIEVIEHVETWLEEINNIVGDYRYNNDVIDADYEVYGDNDNNDEYNEFEEYRDFFDQSIPTRSDGKPMTVFDDPKFMKMYNKNKDIIDNIDINDLFKED